MLFQRQSREGNLLVEGARECKVPFENGSSPPVSIYFACDNYGHSLEEWLSAQTGNYGVVEVIDDLRHGLRAYIIVTDFDVLYVNEYDKLFDETGAAYGKLGSAKQSYFDANLQATKLITRARS